MPGSFIDNEVTTFPEICIYFQYIYLKTWDGTITRIHGPTPTRFPAVVKTADPMEDLADNFTVRLTIEDCEVEGSSGSKTPQPYQRTMYRMVQPTGAKELLDRPVPVSGSFAQGYFLLLQEFRSGYPDSTDIHCWWCCHQFQGKPVGLPKKMYGTAECFQSIGCFCSFGCACAYAKNDRELNSSLALLNSVYRYEMKAKRKGDVQEGGNAATTERVVPAPPRETLQKFGGQMTIEEFRGTSACGKPWTLLNAPCLLKRF